MPYAPNTLVYEPPVHLGVSRATWEKRLRRDPCFACGRRPSKSRATIEHVEPRSAGGRNDFTNIVGACAACNEAKGSRSLLVYLLETLDNEAAADGDRAELLADAARELRAPLGVLTNPIIRGERRDDAIRRVVDVLKRAPGGLLFAPSGRPRAQLAGALASVAMTTALADVAGMVHA